MKTMKFDRVAARCCSAPSTTCAAGRPCPAHRCRRWWSAATEDRDNGSPQKLLDALAECPLRGGARYAYGLGHRSRSWVSDSRLPGA
jgi:hypothetical protein